MSCSEKRISELESENEQLRQENADLREQIGYLSELVQELKQRLSLESTTSSKPPSSDGLRKKPAPESLRQKGLRKSGGQKGHKGHSLAFSEKPDELVLHHRQECSNCGRDLSEVEAELLERRQVFDLPTPEVEVREHRILCKRCRACGSEEKGSFPQGVNSPVSYGLGIQAWSVYLQHGHFIAEKRLSEIFRELFNVRLAPATLASFAKKLSDKLQGWINAQESALEKAAIKHLDETGFRIAGKTCWLHSISTEGATVFRAREKRGEVPEKTTGIAVHDHFKSYYARLPLAKHALCNAHHLRELKALIKGDEPWACAMYKLLCLVSKVEKKGYNEAVAMRISSLYDRIEEQGLAYHESLPPYAQTKPKRGREAKRPGHNLLIRLRDYKEDVLRCLYNEAVPFTNNEAERAIRMMKVKQKVSGGFRSMEGAHCFATTRSFFSTAAKQKLNILQSIREVFSGLSPPLFT